jgi:hypothetical protein
MGSSPTDDPGGYREFAVFDCVPNVYEARLMIVHELIDENVHFRHTASLKINKAQYYYW